MSTPTPLEDRLTAALAARAELVQPEHLSPAPRAALPRRRRTPLLVLAAAACLLLAAVLTLTFGQDDRRVAPAPEPTRPELVFPPDVGRDWKADDLSQPARLDLDGDGTVEKVFFLAEPSPGFDARTRLQTTLSSTGDEAYGIAQLGTTIGTNALDPIDADGDGDQELVLYREDLGGGPGAPVTPLVFDLRDGVLVEAPPAERDLLFTGDLAVPGSSTTYYDLVHSHTYWIEDGALFSSRSVSAFARGNMVLLRPETYLADTHEWTLGEEGLLHPSDTGCMAVSSQQRTACDPGQVDDPPDVARVAKETIGIGESARFDDGYVFTARIEAAADPSLVVEGSDGRTLQHGLEVADPRVSTVQPMSVFSDGASLLVTSGSDPTYIQVLVQDRDGLRALRPVGEIDLANEGPVRTWLTQHGALVTVVAGDDGTWQSWRWMLVSRTAMAALPLGTVCFGDVEDPATARSC